MGLMYTDRTSRSWRRATTACLAVAGVLVSACAPQGTPDATDQAPVDEPAPRKQIIQPEGVARLPVFSSAVRSGDLIFLSGAIGALPGVSPPTLAAAGLAFAARVEVECIAAAPEGDG